MKSYTMFNYDLLFGDHFAKVSNQAKLYYIKLNFYADRGFVANPISVLDSLGFDKSVFQELVINGEILTLPNRCEVFITSYFVHNRFNGKGDNKAAKSWLSSPFAQYWKGKLWTKGNGVATFKPQDEPTVTDPLANVIAPVSNQDWNNLFDGEPQPTVNGEDDDLPF